MCLFVCLFICSLCTPRSFDGSSPNLVGVCRWTSHLPLRGSFSKRVNDSTGQRVTFAFHYIIYAPASCHTAATAPFAWQAAESNSAPFAVLHVNDVCRWTWQLLLRGSFSKRSTGRRVNGSNGSTGVTFTFTVLYMIPDDARLTPPCCKKHTAYDDTSLMPHRCKKHTASFARSTGKFPSITNSSNVYMCYVDLSKALDRTEHVILFRKLRE